MKRLMISLTFICILGFLMSGVSGCGGQNCGNLAMSSHNVLELCETDCPFNTPEAFTITQDGCVVGLIWDSSEDESDAEILESCEGLFTIQPTGGREGFFISSRQDCTGNKGTTCAVTMTEPESPCPDEN